MQVVNGTQQKSSTENVQVFLRMRPFNKKEIERNEVNVWTISKNHLRLNGECFNSLLKQHKVCSPPFTKSCVFNGCFDSFSTSTEIYKTTLKTLIEGSLKGINGTLFLYGQTGSGKTYTMMGDYNEENKTGREQGTSRGRRTPIKENHTPQLIERSRTPLKKKQYNPLKALDGDLNEGVLVLSLKDIFTQIEQVTITKITIDQR